MIKLSVVVSSIRPHRWYNFCTYVSKNNLSLEVIFVGPPSNIDINSFPVPARFYKTNCNAARCWAIGSYFARSEFIVHAADDCYFSHSFFDTAVDILSRSGPLDMVTALYVRDHANQLHDMRMAPGMPLLPVGGVTRLQGFHTVGGIDKRFHSVVWDSDLYTRFIVKGGSTILLDKHEYHELSNESSLFEIHHRPDKTLLDLLWKRNGIYTLNRTSETQSYTHEELTECLL